MGCECLNQITSRKNRLDRKTKCRSCFRVGVNYVPGMNNKGAGTGQNYSNAKTLNDRALTPPAQIPDEPYGQTATDRL